jgi:hypothetical protein
MVTKSTHSTHVLCGIHPVQSFDLPDTVKIASIKFHSSKNMKGGRGFKIKYYICKYYKPFFNIKLIIIASAIYNNI